MKDRRVSEEISPVRKFVALITMISYPDKGGRPEGSVRTAIVF